MKLKQLIQMLVLMPMMALAGTEVVNGVTWTYTINNGKAQVGTGLFLSPAISTSTKGAIIIPSRLGGCPVTSIGNYAFHGCSGLTSVSIPEGVTSIGERAFDDCSGLASVTIPSSVTSIGRQAFRGCSGLTSVTIPSSVTNVGDFAFRGCSGLTSVTIPEGVTSIGKYAFEGCGGLTSVTIPSSVTSIGSVFLGCAKIVVAADNPQYKSVNGCIFRKAMGVRSMDSGMLPGLRRRRAQAAAAEKKRAEKESESEQQRQAHREEQHRQLQDLKDEIQRLREMNKARAAASPMK